MYIQNKEQFLHPKSESNKSLTKAHRSYIIIIIITIIYNLYVEYLQLCT